MQQPQWNEVVKGSDWVLPMQRSQNAQAIQSSTNTSPIVVKRRQHRYSNGDKVRISLHDSNAAANGNWTIANVTADTFELVGSSGSGIGGEDGYVSKCIDGTGSIITAVLKDKEEGGATILTPTFEWIDQTILSWRLSLTDTQTAAVTQDKLYLRVWWKDSLGFDKLILADTLKFKTV